jgi:hypothetical protein
MSTNIFTKKPRPLPPPDLGVETDCEDQGFSLLSDGCLACLPSFPDGKKSVYPALVKRQVNGTWWWYCPNGHGSYGAVEGTAK